MEKAYQMQPAQETVAVTTAKVGSLWALVYVGLTSWDWGTVAAVLASIYSAILIAEKVARVIVSLMARRGK